MEFVAQAEDEERVPLARKGEGGLKHSIDDEPNPFAEFPSPERARAD